MRILAVNAGSSSLKLALLEDEQRPIAGHQLPSAGEGFDHPRHVVGVDAVHAHGQHRVEHTPVLGIPCQRVALEAVPQRHQPPRPVRVVEVDGVDAEGGVASRPSLGALLDRPQAGGVDQTHIVRQLAPTRHDVE